MPSSAAFNFAINRKTQSGYRRSPNLTSIFCRDMLDCMGVATFQYYKFRVWRGSRYHQCMHKATVREFPKPFGKILTSDRVWRRFHHTENDLKPYEGTSREFQAVQRELHMEVLYQS